jgi:prolyl oligopeptidase
VWRYDGEVLFYTQQRARAAGEPAPEQFRNSQAFMRTFAPGGLERDTALLGSGLDPAITIDKEDTPAIYVSPVSPFAIGVVSHGVQDEMTLYVAPLTQLRGVATPWRKLATADHGITDFDLRGEWIYLLTHENADRNQVVRWSLRDPQPYALADAEVVVAASDRVLRSVNVAKDALYVHETDGGYDTLRRLEYNVKLKRVAAPAARGGTRARVPKTAAALPKTAGIARGTELKLPYRGAIEEIVTDPQRAGALVRVAGWTEPPSYYSIDGKTGALAPTTLLPRSGADWSAYAATDVTVKSHDGVSVPLTIISAKNVARDGSAPLLLEAYGAYGISEAPQFWPSLAVWLERGGVYAVAHVRGGGELGEAWHRAGYLRNKPNSWRDLIAAAEWLIGERWTAPSRLALIGGSAGGLTVSNAMIERPDLFAAMVSQSGFHDTVRSETGAAGPANVPEFGTVATEGWPGRSVGDEQLRACHGRRRLSCGAADDRLSRRAGRPVGPREDGRAVAGDQRGTRRTGQSGVAAREFRRRSRQQVPRARPTRPPTCSRSCCGGPARRILRCPDRQSGGWCFPVRRRGLVEIGQRLDPLFHASSCGVSIPAASRSGNFISARHSPATIG